jgi:PKD repeat protein
MGWNEGVFVDGTRTGQKHQNDSMSFKNNILAGNLRAINNSSFSGARAKVLSQNDSIFSATGVLNDPFNYTNPSFAPSEGSPALTGASFTDARVADAFFTQTPFRGAMGNNPDSNWTNCWCNFDPQNTNYNSSPINNPAATANFTAPSASNSLKVDFANTSSNATSYMWDFGVAASSNDTSSAANPSFTYPNNGKYTVTLIAKSKCGNSTKTFEVTVNDVSILPIVDYTFVQNNTTGSRELSFTNTTTEKGLTIDYTWKFGDGATANTKNATHTYTSNGSYTVTLIATHIYGVDSVSKTINVIATSVSEEVSAFNNFVMYPNPTRENVTIDFNLIKSETVSVSIMDLSGKEIISLPASRMNVGKQSMELSTSELSEGMYIVRVNGVESSISSRLVIIK